MRYQHWSGINYQRGLGLPLDWFMSEWHWHLTVHRMRKLPTMMVLAEPLEHRNVALYTMLAVQRLPRDSAAHPGVQSAIP